MKKMEKFNPKDVQTLKINPKYSVDHLEFENLSKDFFNGDPHDLTLES